MNYLCDELRQAATRGNVLELNDVWDHYEVFAAESLCTVPQSFKSRRATFRSSLQLNIGDHYTFIRQLNREISERKMLLFPITKYGSNRSNVINLEQDVDQTTLPVHKSKIDMFQYLVHVALKIRSDIMDIAESDVMSINEQNAIDCVPDSLNLLLRLILGGQEELDSLDDVNELQDDLRSPTVGLSIAQDVVYAAHGSRK